MLVLSPIIFVLKRLPIIPKIMLALFGKPYQWCLLQEGPKSRAKCLLYIAIARFKIPVPNLVPG